VDLILQLINGGKKPEHKVRDIVRSWKISTEGENLMTKALDPATKPEAMSYLRGLQPSELRHKLKHDWKVPRDDIKLIVAGVEGGIDFDELMGWLNSVEGRALTALNRAPAVDVATAGKADPVETEEQIAEKKKLEGEKKAMAAEQTRLADEDKAAKKKEAQEAKAAEKARKAKEKEAKKAQAAEEKEAKKAKAAEEKARKETEKARAEEIDVTINPLDDGSGAVDPTLVGPTDPEDPTA
jgi:hypothetical protein